MSGSPGRPTLWTVVPRKTPPPPRSLTKRGKRYWKAQYAILEKTAPVTPADLIVLERLARLEEMFEESLDRLEAQGVLAGDDVNPMFRVAEKLTVMVEKQERALLLSRFSRKTRNSKIDTLKETPRTGSPTDNVVDLMARNRSSKLAK